MASTPQFATAPKVGVQTISTANTNTDGTGTIATVFTAGTNGSRVDKIVVMANGATTSEGTIRIFLHNGTTAYLYREIPVSTTKGGVGQTGLRYQAELASEVVGSNLPLIIPTGYSVRASTHKAESFNIFVMGADL